MVLIREVFFCKPGQTRPFVEKMKTMSTLGEKAGMPKMKIMTDISSERYWMVVMEVEAGSVGEFEAMMAKGMQNKELEAAMKGYHDFVDCGRREIYRLES